MKSKLILVFAIHFIMNYAGAQPPNNAIFFGSRGDGFTKQNAAIAQAAIFSGGRGDGANYASNGMLSNTIFVGGNGDGFNKASNGSISNTIFTGGRGDGFHKTSNGSLSNTIFVGGQGDGFHKSANGSISNNIFIGGDGDGWKFSVNSSTPNSIFIGGRGDGWSSVYKPQGPLPVNILYFTAQKNTATSSLLNWKTSQEINSAYFDVERSMDAVVFKKIGKVLAAGNSSTEKVYSFIDNNPEPGINYYRLKQVDVDGKFIYTPARQLIFDKTEAGTVKYYPNPTNGLLTIELPNINNQEMKLVNISNSAGLVVNQLRISSNSGNKIQFDFSKYAKGIYFIQIKTNSLNSTERIVLQ